jgi:hypothetical protein
MASLALLLSCSTAHLVAPPAIPQPAPGKGASAEIREAILRAYMEELDGSWSRADSEFLKAAEAASCDPWLEKAWGTCAWRMGENGEAIAHWEQAMLCFGLEEDRTRADIARMIRTAQKSGDGAQ